MKNQKRIVSALALASLAGCSSFFTPVGENKFDCNRRQGGNSEYCKSFKAMNKSTDSPLPDSRFDSSFSMSDYDRAVGIAPDSAKTLKSESPQGQQAQQVYVNGTLPSSRVSGQVTGVSRPLRLAPVVQRTWIKPFAAGSDMHGATLVYREIIPARWAGFEDAGTSNNGSALSGSRVYPHYVAADVEESKPRGMGGNIKQTPQSSGSAKTSQTSTPSMSSTQQGMAQSLAQPRDDVVPPASLDNEADSKPQ